MVLDEGLFCVVSRRTVGEKEGGGLQGGGKGRAGSFAATRDRNREERGRGEEEKSRRDGCHGTLEDR